MKKILLALLMVCGLTFGASAQSGYRGFADIDLGCTFADDPGFTTNLSTTHGYQFNGHIFLGAGLGIGYNGAQGGREGYLEIDLPYEYGEGRYVKEYYYQHHDAGMQIPIFLDFRYDYSLIKKTSFYWNQRIGYNAGTNMENFFITPEFGVHFGTRKNISYNLGLRIPIDLFPWYYEDEVTCGVCVAFGIEF